MAAKGEAKRTVSFFRLVLEKSDGSLARLAAVDWTVLLDKVSKLSFEERAHQGPTRQLIGQALSVDGSHALKLLEPRDENSWLELLRKSKAAESAHGRDSVPVDPEELGILVETSIIAFVESAPHVFGIIRGSTASPSHAAVAEWLEHIEVEGKRVVPPGGGVLRAEPVLSREQLRQLKASDGVSAASVRVSTSKASALTAAGSVLADTMTGLRRTYGDMIVTISMRVPTGRKYDEARGLLRQEAQRLQSATGDMEAVSATLVTYNEEQRAHSEEVNFVSQRLTAKTSVQMRGEDGKSIRNESAVRAIRQAADRFGGRLAEE